MPVDDLGAAAYRKVDIEAWMPSRGNFGEISSASDCTDYQSRRLNIRYRPTGSAAAERSAATRFVHTLNGTACAVPRAIIAILENNVTDDGNAVVLPECLRPFMGGRKLITASQAAARV